jgi:hypothetical protein
MGWFDMFSRKAGATADGHAITMFNGMPQHAGSASAETSADAPTPPLSEEIKRRQVALIISYVTAIRAR